MTMKCDLCNTQIPDDHPTVCGLDLCHDCYNADLTNRAKSWGWSLSVNLYDRTLYDRAGEKTVHHAELDASITPATGPMKISFEREGLKSDIAKVLVREIQVGDPLFDKAIWIRTKTREPAEEFLKQEGVQTAIMGLGVGGKLEIDGGTVVAHAMDDFGIDYQRYLLEAVALLYYLHRFNSTWAEDHEGS